jgi:HSP90 family molecular chaperone
MDKEGLRQYFTIGASEKRANTESERLRRSRIGEFGIGKFAALAASSRFEVETKSGDFHARLVFDKETWTLHEDWHINIDILPSDMAHPNGTIITLRNPTISLVHGIVRRYLSERIGKACPKTKSCFPKRACL